jgi:DCC1-like thiol-disulfide oxidoreductase
MFSTQSTPPSQERSTAWQIELLYDGACPLCVREVNFLKTQDADRGLVSFVDIADDAYNPADHAGIDFETAMGRSYPMDRSSKMWKYFAGHMKCSALAGSMPLPKSPRSNTLPICSMVSGQICGLS